MADIRLTGRAFALCCVIAAIAACGGRRVPDLEPPDVTIVELIGSDDATQIQIRLDNPVAAPMDIDSLAIAIDFGTTRTRIDRPFDLTVAPLGSEVLEHTMDATITGEGRLEYEVTGQVILDSGRTMRVEKKGRLYPTPGREGSYR